MLRFNVLFPLAISAAVFSACTPPAIKPDNPGLENANLSIAQECIDRSTGGDMSGEESTANFLSLLALGVTAETGNADAGLAVLEGADLETASNHGEIRAARQVSGIYSCMTQAANVTSYGAAYYIANAWGSQSELSASIDLFSPELQSALRRHGFV